VILEGFMTSLDGVADSVVGSRLVWSSGIFLRIFSVLRRGCNP
jgi:hypothetical protein